MAAACCLVQTALAAPVYQPAGNRAGARVGGRNAAFRTGGIDVNTSLGYRAYRGETRLISCSEQSAPGDAVRRPRSVADKRGVDVADPSPLPAWRARILDSGLPPIVRLVALVLSMEMTRNGYGHPGAAKLRRKTGLSERAVKDSLHRLDHDGWLVLVESGGLKGEARKANAYQVAIPNPGTTGTRAGGAPVQEIPTTHAPRAHQKLVSPSGKPRDADPQAKAQQAQEQLRERNRLRLLGQACPKCEGSAMVEAHGGYAPCPACNASAS